ncbi:hypothetical protein AX774_g7411 [Zancudomyces culisetae]|uniref:Uncharacterized protein n=1 Tax=Zancudomyces culisetae TaxID=1213189 RepID=A0A1R1PE53_ZANCU|nr:hypothetical protein AX774_g7411 [Zancudomyces culisetae]|eukprot:OMH79183.1 hypothetical protein AX774_g7411 [Zancudomyces culisetae]
MTVLSMHKHFPLIFYYEAKAAQLRKIQKVTLKNQTMSSTRISDQAASSFDYGSEYMRWRKSGIACMAYQYKDYLFLPLYLPPI